MAGNEDGGSLEDEAGYCKIRESETLWCWEYSKSNGDREIFTKEKG